MPPVTQVRPLAAAAGSALRLPWPRLGQDWPLHTLAGILENLRQSDREPCPAAFWDRIPSKPAINLFR